MFVASGTIERAAESPCYPGSRESQYSGRRPRMSDGNYQNADLTRWMMLKKSRRRKYRRISGLLDQTRH
jgi:hypothetical protein